MEQFGCAPFFFFFAIILQAFDAVAPHLNNNNKQWATICQALRITLLAGGKTLNKLWLSAAFFPGTTLDLEQGRLAGCSLRKGADWL